MKQTEDPKLTIITVEGDTPSTVELPQSVEPAAPAAEQQSPESPPEQNPTSETTLKEVIQKHGQEEAKAGKMTLRNVLGGDLLTSDFIKRQIGLLLLVALFFVIYIANGFSYRQKILVAAQLKDSLEKARIESLSSISKLTKYTRETNVTQMLRNNGDTLLKVSNTPPIIVYDDPE